MINLRDVELLDIIPDSIDKDDKLRAYSLASKDVHQMIYNFMKHASVYNTLDEQPEEVLDLLAAELRTQYYDTSLAKDKKVNLILNTLMWYQTAGTPKAITELINVVFGTGEVKEWFSFPSEEQQLFSFDILAYKAIITPDTLALFNGIIKMVKAVGSNLRHVSINQDAQHNINFVSRINLTESIIVS